MKNLKIYRVEDKYIHYLHNIDNKVQHNKNAKRPYVGVVFSFGGFNYFVPMESPKPNHSKIKAGKHILKLKNGEYGLLGFNNMIPVHSDALIEFDIARESDEKYRNLLQNQLRVCNRMKADILDHAQKTYFGVIGGSRFLVNISCDFKKLEKACKKYNPNYCNNKSN
ncbi:MAG: type III toxin-antitoxin system ToxN/AbiQ family toxin [Clostridia bacterium]|nr:type III toxin-antitoxin system ToxN/AbiQ family toxin [Clostridia bacterium]